MKKQLVIFRDMLADKILDDLWSDWTSLGVPGVNNSVDKLVLIDPEALILMSIELGYMDLRLFDEVLSWLIANSGLINTKRLAKLQKESDLGSLRVLAGIAEHVGEKQVSWKRFLRQSDYEEPEVEWQKGKMKCDPLFAKHGVHRSVFKDRELSSHFNYSTSSALLLRLRGLMGMNAHCEVICYYADGRSVHASKAARDLSYSQKAIQDTLSKMEEVGAVSSYNERKNRLFKLNLNLLQGLVPAGVRWKNRINIYSYEKDKYLLSKKMVELAEAGQSIELIGTVAKHEYSGWKKCHPRFYEASIEKFKSEAFLDSLMELWS